MPRPFCAGCGKGIDSSNFRRAKNVIFRLFTSARASKHLQPDDLVCLSYYKKFKFWFTKANSLYDRLIDIDLSTKSEDDNENDNLFRS